MDGAGTRTVLFTDTVSSTQLRAALGAVAADDLRAELDRRLSRSVAHHDGTVVKGTGDGIMAVFESGARPVDCAVELQHEVTARAASRDVPLAIRAGLSAGDVSWTEGDYFGMPV